jgi:molybdenum cofactor cytidylyltransferase
MTIALVILAAGASRRFGTASKLVADTGGEPLIARVVRRLSAARVDGAPIPVTVVTGAAGDPVAVALGEAGLRPAPRLVVNPQAAKGIGTSIAAGVASVDAGTRAVVITPGDMPLLTADLIERLVAAFQANGGQPVCTVLPDGTPASPILWPRRLFPGLMALDGDRGGRALLAGEPACSMVQPAPGELADIDTQDDLARLMAVVDKSAGP